MTLKQSSNNERRIDKSAHDARKVRRAHARDERNFNNALRSRDLSRIIDDFDDELDHWAFLSSDVPDQT